MPDIQQRWALVIDGAGAVHREDIALASPKGGAAVVRHERFLRDGQAEVRSSVVLSGMSAAELSVGDRQHGRVGMDQLLCRHFASENRDCALRRESSDFVMASAYRIDAELVDLKALDRVGDHYVRAQVHHMTDEWEAFARYRRSGQLSDLYLGSPETASYDVTLTGATVESPALHCTLRSSGSTGLDGEPTDAGYRYRYKSVRKAAGSATPKSCRTHSARRSSRAAPAQLRMAVKLPPA